MSTVDDLFGAFRTAFRERGDVDPHEYLDQVSGTDRSELEALIDGFLATGPTRAFDEAAFARFQADPLAQRILASVGVAATAAETWATLLPAARERAQIKRSLLVERLARALGVSGRERKVAGYYHRMEHGTLEPESVSPKVLEALSAIVDVSVERLREAGRRMAPPAAGGMPAFARAIAASPVEYSMPAPGPEAPADEDAWDEVDELFCGG